jgi:transcriptional regulator with PAS, ATPase and Fis domain
MRVGSTEVRKVDVRIIAATHFNLEEMVQKGKFRPDLFYRLNVINVELPNLRARKEDIEVLTLHFIEKFNQKTNKKIKGIEPAAMEAMKTYNWPGNVRELENAIERATVIEKTEWITLNSLPVTLQRAKSFIDHPFNVPESAASVITQSYKEAKKQALAGFNHHYLSKLMKQTSGNISKAALLAGMERSNFKKLLNLADLDPRKYKKKLSDSMDVDDATFEATSKVN